MKLYMNISEREQCQTFIKAYQKLCTNLQVNNPMSIIENARENIAYVEDLTNTICLFKKIAGNPVGFTTELENT